MKRQHVQREFMGLGLKSVLLAFLLALNASGAAYFIDYVGGSDSNSGTSTNSPWKRHPYMSGFAGTYSHTAGDRFYFKGGVTWPATCFPLTIEGDGTAGAHDFYGSRSNWFSGASFVRPIFDRQHVVSSAHLINAQGRSWIDFVGLDLRGITAPRGSLTARQDLFPGEYEPTFTWILFCGQGSNIFVTNCWIHDWRVASDVTFDSHHGGFCGWCCGAKIPNIIIADSEISNAENTDRWNGELVYGASAIYRSKFHDNAAGLVSVRTFVSNELYRIAYPYPPLNSSEHSMHLNGLYVFAQYDGDNTLAPEPSVIANNVFRDVGPGCNQLILDAYPGSTAYVYNNVFYGNMSGQFALNIGACFACPGGFAPNSRTYVLNNTVYFTNAGSLFPMTWSSGTDYLYIQNNHIIGDGAYIQQGSRNPNVANNLIQPTAQAAAAGYSGDDLWKPRRANAPTVDGGTGEAASIFSNDRLGVFRPQRAGWDIGAYEFSFAPPAPPGNLRVVTSP